MICKESNKVERLDFVGVVGEVAQSDGGSIYNPAANGMTVYSADEMFEDAQEMKRNNPLSPSNFDTFEAYQRALNNTPEMKKMRVQHALNYLEMEVDIARKERNLMALNKTIDVTGVLIYGGVEFAIDRFTGLLFFLPVGPPMYNEYQGPLRPHEVH